MNDVQYLGDSDFDLKLAGRKAAHLHQLVLAGFQIPAGFTIAAGDRENDTWLRAVEKIGGYPVAVRSSGNLEDLGEASFAGQYESFLNVSGADDLFEKIRKCRQTAESPTVKAYLNKKGISAQGHSLSVLVQKMIPARFAGVGFSIHPMTGKEEHGLLECCTGLGEKLVSGLMTPTQYVVNLKDGSIFKETLGSEQLRMETTLLQGLSRQLLEIQAYFGLPQDVEWAIDSENKLWILQARPITKIHWRKDVEEYSNADFKDGGVSARVCTPLMYSLYRDAVQRSMPKYFQDIKLDFQADSEKWIEFFYGRPYWNASAIKRRLSRLPGYDEEAFDKDIGVQKKYGPSGGVRTPTTLRTLVPAIPVALALEWHYKKQLQYVEKFREIFAVRDASYLRKIDGFSTLSDQDFYLDFTEVLSDFYIFTETSYFTTIYNNSNAQTELKSFIRKLDLKTSGTTSLIRLMSGLADISHLNMQRGLLSLYRIAGKEGMDSLSWVNEFRQFMTKNYFHSDAELELMTPRWGEVPERVKETVNGMLKSGSKPMDPDESIVRQRKEYELELGSVRKRIAQLKKQGLWIAYFSLSAAFEKHLTRVRTYLSRREEMREYSTRCYYVVRRYILEAGRRLALSGRIPTAESIFMLHSDEIIDLVQGKKEWNGKGLIGDLLSFRKKMYDSYRHLIPPNELGKDVEQSPEQSLVDLSHGKTGMIGLGCSPGVAEGTARVIDSLKDIGQIQNGDILITRFTDPGWTPALGLVAGIVTEVGGMLSHAAVISREYGIPAILNLPGVTRRIKSGSRLRIDGSSGQVVVLEEPLVLRSAASQGRVIESDLVENKEVIL